MRRRIPLLSLLLATALLAGQWLAAAHDPDHHSMLPGASHGCVICVYAHGAGHGALPSAPMLLLNLSGEAPRAEPATAPVAVTVRLHPIRGPPALLA